ncbi:uncharacterized protein LOC115157701 [Salmo trutta]|uniref:uncharacterized protein LOC115157701 n=1 Tax=Salmo trutta TaxID=8032 RepID=UPI001130DE1D|nr:uncharacterized protein LOC115157701 [Salmo trutta]
MVHYLLLQSQGQVPPHVTTEHMSNWLVSQSKKSLRERVWKETLEEGNDLARLAWEVNTCLKMMDIEHEAFCKLRRSMHSTSPADIDPKVHSIVERAVRSILGEQSNEPRSNLLRPSQVVVEVVPRLLLALWLQPEEGHSEHPILISGMAVGMVAAVVEKLSCMLKDLSHHIPFSQAAAFDSVRSILGRISQSFSTDDLQSPFYMSSVCAFVADEVQSCFQPPTATLPVPPVLAVAVSTTRLADIQADPASSHLEVVKVPPNKEADPEADPGCSHLEVVDITPNTEADPGSSHLEVVNITPNTDADPGSSHLNVVDITTNTEAEPISSLLEVVDVTPEERTLTMAVFATLPADIQAEDVAVVIPDVTPHVIKDYIAMIVSYVAALLIISVRPCWDDAINLLPENINTKHIGSPFHGSGQYTAYHNVLNNGQVYLAPYSTDLLRRNKHKSNIYRKLFNYLFTTLLLSGDVQLSPGPNITEPAILTAVDGLVH